MPIFKYDILNPVKDNKRPFFDEKRGLFYIPVKANYRYYIEAFHKDKIHLHQEFVNF